MLVLEVFHRLCADADGLVELFLSYDADFDSFDIYRNVVISLGSSREGAHAYSGVEKRVGASRPMMGH